MMATPAKKPSIGTPYSIEKTLFWIKHLLINNLWITKLPKCVTVL